MEQALKLLRNKAIESLSQEHGAEIIKLFECVGAKNNRNLHGIMIGSLYFINSYDKIRCYDKGFHPKDVEIITIEEAKEIIAKAQSGESEIGIKTLLETLPKVARKISNSYENVGLWEEASGISEIVTVDSKRKTTWDEEKTKFIDFEATKAKAIDTFKSEFTANVNHLQSVVNKLKDTETYILQATPTESNPKSEAESNKKYHCYTSGTDYSVYHVEDGDSKLMAVAEDYEKAVFIAKACNLYDHFSNGDELQINWNEI